jgi:hypothetical protein
MNNNNPQGFDDRIDEREWLAQERAWRDARDGLPSTDPMALRYRKVADALRTPLPDSLPEDFAASVARLADFNATAPAAQTDVQDAPFERTLLRGALGILGLGSAVVVAMFGRAWLAPTLGLLQLDSAGAVNWALALAACIGATWLTEQLRRRRMDEGHAA